MREDSLILYGAGGHCKVVIDILDALGKEVAGIVDDNPRTDLFMNFRLETPKNSYRSAIITIGNCKIREAIANRIDVEEFFTAVHPSAIVSPRSRIGEGTVVMQGAVIQACANIGNHCIINTKASVGHDVVVHDFVHVASGATVCGEVEIGACTWLGAGSVVKQGVKIGRNCMIGAGSVVVKDIPDNVVAFGNPCHVVCAYD